MTPIPILLVGGYLGAGKTTLINHVLTVPGAPRMAAIVNDFGDINIDASLLGHVSNTVIGLKNGCICCSLQGDLLSTLSSLTRRQPPPDAIIVETSGVANLADIIRALFDPVIVTATPLDTVVTLVDLQSLSDHPALMDDPLWRTQLNAGDYLFLTKSDLVSANERSKLRKAIVTQRPGVPVFETRPGTFPTDLLFGNEYHLLRRPSLSRPVGDRFESTHWSSSAPLSLNRFQKIIRPVAAKSLRSKGLFRFVENPDQTVLFQSVGLRATLAPSSVPLDAGTTAQFVVIGRQGEIDATEIDRALNAMETIRQN